MDVMLYVMLVIAVFLVLVGIAKNCVVRNADEMRHRHGPDRGTSAPDVSL